MKELEGAFEQYREQVRELARVAVSRAPAAFTPRRYRWLKILSVSSAALALFCWGSNLTFLSLPLALIAIAAYAAHETVLRRVVEPELRERIEKGELSELLSEIKKHSDLQKELTKIMQENPLFLSYDLSQITSYPRRKSSRFDWTSYDELRREGLINAQAETAKSLIRAKAKTFQ